ncbi:MAG: hypothetical protein J6V77_04495 [Clostridia bacterium]|nr:hypothetical protein [Clostridia bacterium]
MKILQIISIILVAIAVVMFVVWGALDLMYGLEFLKVPENDLRDELQWTAVALGAVGIIGFVVTGSVLNKREQKSKIDDSKQNPQSNEDTQSDEPLDDSSKIYDNYPFEEEREDDAPEIKQDRAKRKKILCAGGIAWILISIVAVVVDFVLYRRMAISLIGVIGGGAIAVSIRNIVDWCVYAKTKNQNVLYEAIKGTVIFVLVAGFAVILLVKFIGSLA